MSENTEMTVTTSRETADAEKLQKAKDLAIVVKLVNAKLDKAQNADRRGIVDVVHAMFEAGDNVRTAIEQGLVSSVNGFARAAAGFTSATWKDYVAAKRADAGDDGLQVAVPRQKSFDRAVKLAASLEGLVSDGSREEMAVMVDEYLSVTPDNASAVNGPRSFLAWTTNGQKHAEHATRGPVKVTFAPAKLAAKLAAKLSPAQVRQLAAALVKLADAASAPKVDTLAA